MPTTTPAKTRITNAFPPTLATEFHTLVNASGGGVPQSAVTPELERNLIARLGRSEGLELIALLNAVGKGVSKKASVKLLNSFGHEFGSSMRRELETILTTIS